MKMTIESGANGAVVVAHADPDDEVKTDRKYFYEFDEEDEEKGLARLVDMFYDIMEMQGWNVNTKYSKERVSIRLEHGHDYECKDKPCEICDRSKE